MIRAIRASAVNHALDPSNLAKTYGLEDGGGSPQTRKNAAYTCINKKG